MKLYRGTKNAGLKVMEPRLVNHDKPYVYATTDKIECILYSVKGGNLNYTNIYGFDEDGNRCLIERKENALEDIFNNEGRYYILDDTTFYKHEALGVGNNEYVSEVPVKVKEEITIPNVWEYFKILEKKGKLKIYRYPNRPKKYPKDDSDLIECAELTYAETDDLEGSYMLLEKYHPELKKKIEESKNKVKNMTKEEIIKSAKFFK